MLNPLSLGQWDPLIFFVILENWEISAIVWTRAGKKLGKKMNRKEMKRKKKKINYLEKEEEEERDE